MFRARREVFEKFVRVLPSDQFDGIPYDDNVIPYPSCHLGRKKLLFSEIEFLTLVAKHDNVRTFSNYYAVYAGGIPGYHIPELLNMFDGLEMLIYDPRDIDFSDDRVIKKGIFLDSSISEVIEIANGREILFISDIRIEKKESLIWKDMVMQQKWGILMNAKYMLLKFRPPYVLHDKINVVYDIEYQDKINKCGEPDMDCSFMYLTGDIYFQLYPSKISSETRLFVKRGNNNKYDMKYYDYEQYENQMFYFNTHYRCALFTYENSAVLKDNIIGYDDGYESVSEYHIMHNYSQNVKGVNIVSEINRLNTICNNITGDNVITGIFRTFALGYVLTYDNTTKINSEKLLNIVDVHRRIMDSIPTLNIIISEQVKKINESKLLSSDEKNKQFESYNTNKNVFDIKNCTITINKKLYEKYKNVLNTFIKQIYSETCDKIDYYMK